MIFDILETKLQEANLGNPGENLFRDTIPPTISDAICIREPLDGIPIDPNLQGFFRTRFQVIVRSSDVVRGEVLTHRISKALTHYGPENFPETEVRAKTKINFFIPETLPIRYPRMDGDEVEFSTHFKCSFAF